jgi:hypothetical protein
MHSTEPDRYNMAGHFHWAENVIQGRDQEISKADLEHQRQRDAVEKVVQERIAERQATSERERGNHQNELQLHICIANEAIHANKQLAIDNTALTEDNAQLVAGNIALTGTNTQIENGNAQLTANNTRLAARQTQLTQMCRVLLHSYAETWCIFLRAGTFQDQVIQEAKATIRDLRFANSYYRKLCASMLAIMAFCIIITVEFFYLCPYGQAMVSVKNPTNHPSPDAIPAALGFCTVSIA